MVVDQVKGMDDLASGDMTIEASSAEDEQKKITDPKLYKTSLCQFYLKGPCKNGENCSFLRESSLFGVKIG